MAAIARAVTRRFVMAILALVTIAGGATAATTPAAAWGNACETQGNLVGEYAVSGSWGRVATIKVYYQSGTGRNCAVNYCYGWTCGENRYRVISIKPSNYSNWTDLDRRYSTLTTSSVSAYAPGRCIDIFASVGTSSASYRNLGARYLDNVHCG